jgi:lipopolysaccharide export system permease protein
MLIERYLMRLFLPTFAVAMLFFAFIVELADVFGNIFRYVQNGVSILAVVKIQWLYFPKSLVLGMPIACVFAATYILGTLQVRYELLGFFSCGIGISRVAIPLIVMAALISLSSFATNELAAVSWLRQKEAAIDLATGRPPPVSSSDMVIYDKARHRIWRAGFYNNQNEEIQNLTIVQRLPDSTVTGIVIAGLAKWQTNHWKLFNTKTTTIGADDQIALKNAAEIDDSSYDLRPQSFRGQDTPIDTQDLGDAWLDVERRKATGVTFRKEQTRYYERFSFAFTPLVVTLLAISAGRRFRKHVLLLSLLVSLGLAITYYVVQLVAALMSTLGVLPPIVGAWTGCVLFLTVGAGLLWRSETV